MNVFSLHRKISKSVKQHVDKHVVKLPLEVAQLLTTCHHVVGSDLPIPYKPTHQNIPLAKWTRKSLANYQWLVKYGLALCKEYTFRYDKVHKSQAVIEWCRDNMPDIPDKPRTRRPQAMPDEYKHRNVVTAYRTYYNQDKQHLFNWKRRPIPPWTREA